jgi:hypothetical protein
VLFDLTLYRQTSLHIRVVWLDFIQKDKSTHPCCLTWLYIQKDKSTHPCCLTWLDTNWQVYTSVLSDLALYRQISLHIRVVWLDSIQTDKSTHPCCLTWLYTDRQVYSSTGVVWLCCFLFQKDIFVFKSEHALAVLITWDSMIR